MRKILSFCIILSLGLTGCMTVKTPKYVQNKYPYKKQFFANFTDTFNATQQALEETGWKMMDATNPNVYEQESTTAQTQGKSILILTETRQTPLFLSSRYMALNILLREKDNGTEVEIRFGSVMPLLVKNVQTYKNDPVVNKVLNRIKEILKE